MNSDLSVIITARIDEKIATQTLNQQIQQLKLKPINLSVNVEQTTVATLRQQLQRLTANQHTININVNTQQAISQIKNVNQNLNNLQQNINNVGKNTQSINSLSNNFLKMSGAIDNIASSMLHLGKSMVFWHTYEQVIRSVEQGLIGVERQMAGMIQVNPELHSSQQKVNDSTREFIGIAKQYGVSAESVIESAKLWGRAYKDLGTVYELTRSSILLSVVDNLSLEQANKAVEASILQMGMAARTTAEAYSSSRKIVDSWSHVSHNAMVSANQLAEATIRTASVAKKLGMDWDSLTGLISTSVRATGLEGGNIGNMLKSVFGSIHSDKSVAEIEKLGVKMKEVAADGTVTWRKMSDVLPELMVRVAGTSKDIEELTKAASGGKEFATYDKKLSYKKLHEPRNLGCVA